MKVHLAPLACLFVLLAACSSPNSEKAAAEPKSTEPEAARNVKDEPVVVADGSVRLLFRTAAFDLRSLSPIYGCCLATPGIRGKKELRVYLPSSEGSTTVQLAKTLTLGETDVVRFHLERKDDSGWVPLDKDKMPTPQLSLFRRDLSKAAVIEDAQYADFTTAGRSAWIITTELSPKATEEPSALAKNLGMKREYLVGGKNLRLGRLEVKRPDNTVEAVALGNGCSAVEFCTAPNCLAGMNSPCAGAPKE